MIKEGPSDWLLLLVDDNPDIHQDIRKVLQPRVTNQELGMLEMELFGESTTKDVGLDFADSLFRDLVIDSAYQGQEAMTWSRRQPGTARLTFWHLWMFACLQG